MRDWIDALKEVLAYLPFEEMGWSVTLGALLGALLAVVGAGVLGSVLVALIRRLSAHVHPEGGGPSETILRLLRTTLLLFGAAGAVRILGINLVSGLDAHLFNLGDREVTVALVLASAGVLLVAYLLSLIARRGLRQAGQSHDTLARSSLASVGRLLHYVIMAIGLVVAFETLGFDLQALLAVGGLMAIALGFAMQTVVSNFISGVILLVERAIKPDDILEVEGRVVQVRELGIRTTRVRTRDGEDMIVPNSVIAQSVVKNFTHGDTLLRLKVTVGVAYSSDLDHVKRVLETAAAALPSREPSQAAQAILVEFGSSSIDFEVQIWSADPWTSRQLKSDLLFAVWRSLRDEGITIAFPQLDLHLDEPVMAALASAPRSLPAGE